MGEIIIALGITHAVRHCDNFCTQKLKQSLPFFIFTSTKQLFMEKGGWVYILTNYCNKVLYTGVTSDLKSRIYDHKNRKYSDSFTSRYNVNKLVYFEAFGSIDEAIDNEKKIKAGSRQKKIKLIEDFNAQWKELYSEDFEP